MASGPTRPSDAHQRACRIKPDAQNVQPDFSYSQIQDQEVAADPDWVPVPKRMTLKRKYSAFAGSRGGSARSGHAAEVHRRCSGNAVSNRAGLEAIRKGIPCHVEKVSRAPGEIVVPTPVLARSAKITVDHVGTHPDNTARIHGSGLEEGTLQDTPGKQNPESSPCKSKRHRQLGPLRGPLAQQLKALKLKTCIETYITIEGLCQALDNLLQATTSQPPRDSGAGFRVGINERYSEKGSRSLLATCARQVPGYIALEEEWQREEADSADDNDVSAEVYAELEAFGSCEGQGWLYLRETVRAHGVNLLCRALCDGVFRCVITDCGTLNLVLESFILICSLNKATSEMEKLLGAMGEARRLSRPDCEGSGAHGRGKIQVPTAITQSLFRATVDGVLPIARSQANSSSRPYILYEMLSRLMESNNLPTTWLASRNFMEEVWPALIKSLSSIDRNYSGAVRMLEISMMRCCGLSPIGSGSDGDVENSDLTEHHQIIDIFNDDRQNKHDRTTSRYLEDALSNTVFSLCTVMSSVILASTFESQGRIESGSPSFLWAFSFLSSEFFHRISQSQHLNSKDFCSQKQLERITTIIAANVVVAARIPGYLTNMRDLLKLTEKYFHYNSAVQKGSKYNNDLPDGSYNIIYAVALCCARATGGDGFEHLRNIIDAVLKYTRKISSLPYSAWYMNKLCLEAAIAFAERTDRAEYAAYAYEVERNFGKTESIHARKPTARRADHDGSGSNRLIAESTPSRSHAVSQTPSQQRSSRRGFRWEEGICEWIAATPASIFLPKRSVPMISKCGESLDNANMSTGLAIRSAHLQPSKEKISSDQTKTKRKLSSSLSSVSLKPSEEDDQNRDTRVCRPQTNLPPRLGPRLVLASVDVNVDRKRKAENEYESYCKRSKPTVVVYPAGEKQFDHANGAQDENSELDATSISVESTKKGPAKHSSSTRATKTTTSVAATTSNNKKESKPFKLRNSQKAPKYRKSQRSKRKTTFPPPLRRNSSRQARRPIDYSSQQQQPVLSSPISPPSFTPRRLKEGEGRWAVALRTRTRNSKCGQYHRASYPPYFSSSSNSFSSSPVSPASAPASSPTSSLSLNTGTAPAKSTVARMISKRSSVGLGLS